MSDGQRFVLTLVAMGCVTGVAITLGCTLLGVAQAIQRRNGEHDLKRELLERGLSAEEVTRIVEVTPRPQWASGIRGLFDRQ